MPTTIYLFRSFAILVGLSVFVLLSREPPFSDRYNVVPLRSFAFQPQPSLWRSASSAASALLSSSCSHWAPETADLILVTSYLILVWTFVFVLNELVQFVDFPPDLHIGAPNWLPY